MKRALLWAASGGVLLTLALCAPACGWLQTAAVFGTGIALALAVVCAFNR
jgi:hypothetical protein